MRLSEALALYDRPFRAYCATPGERFHVLLTVTDHAGHTTLYRPTLVARWGALVLDGVMHLGLEWSDDSYLPDRQLADSILHAILYDGRPTAGSLSPAPSPLHLNVHYELLPPYDHHPSWNRHSRAA